MLVLGSAVLTAGPTLVAAAEAPDGMEHQQRGARFQQWLGLSDAQMTAIREVWQREAPAAKQHRQALRTAQRDLRVAVLNGADAATIQAKTNVVQQLTAQGVELRVKRLQEITPILTPDQRAKLASARMGGWHRGHGPRGGAQGQQQ
jgi:Spy/CpxP family protein refolding chaperone